MISSKNLQVEQPTTKVGKNITPGTQELKINKAYLSKPPYQTPTEEYNIVLNVETRPIEDFVGFQVDQMDPSKGTYEGQVGTVTASRWTYKDALVNGKEYKRDTSITTFFANLADVLGIREELDVIEAQTIEEWVEKAGPIVSGKYLWFTVGGKQVMNDAGYPKYYMHLVKPQDGKQPMGATEESVVPFNEETHVFKQAPSNTPKVDEFSVSEDSSDLPF